MFFPSLKPECVRSCRKNSQISNCSPFGTLLKVRKIMAVTTLLCGWQKLSKELTTESHFLRSVAGRKYITTKPLKQRTIQFKSSIVDYRHGCEWVEYLLRTDYMNYHSAYTLMSRWNVGRPWERRKDWQPWSGISVKWLKACCWCRSMKHSLK